MVGNIPPAVIPSLGSWNKKSTLKAGAPLMNNQRRIASVGRKRQKVKRESALLKRFSVFILLTRWGVTWNMLIYFVLRRMSTSAVTLTQPTNTLSKSVITNYYNGSYNNYTLITLRASTPAQIQTNFPISPTKTNFGIYPFTIDGFSSIYADSDNYDIMIATVDGIDGPLNKLSYNSFFLINGFSIVDTAISTLNMGFMNYLSSTTLDGSKVPTFLRIKGSISGTTNFDSLSIFFDKLTPFFSNAYTGDVYCTSTDGTPFCQYYDGHINTNNPSVQNYQSMSRFDIKLTAPATSFNIFIPVKIA